MTIAKTTNAAKIDPSPISIFFTSPVGARWFGFAIAAANQGVGFQWPWIISTTKVPGTGTGRGWGFSALAGTGGVNCAVGR